MRRQIFVKVALIATCGLIVSTRHFCIAQEKASRSESRTKNTLRRIEIAKKNFAMAWEQHQQNPELTPSDVGYQWSVRWLQAERDLSGEPKHPRAAQDHLKRMRTWKEQTETLAQAKREKARWDDVDSVEFFVLEAEEWLALANAKDAAQIQLVR